MSMGTQPLLKHGYPGSKKITKTQNNRADATVPIELENSTFRLQALKIAPLGHWWWRISPFEWNIIAWEQLWAIIKSKLASNTLAIYIYLSTLI